MDSPQNNPVSQRERISFFLVLAFLFAFGLFDHSLWSSNDTREGAMIAEMYRSGTWVTPILNGQHYLEKPPLLHWTSLALCHLFGTVNEGLVRLPAALFGFGAVFIAYLFGCRLGKEKAAMAGAFMCGTSILYLEYSKIVLTDLALAFMAMLSLYLFWKAYNSNGSKKLYALFLLVSALSFYAKGLLGPGFVWTSVGIFLLLEKKWRLLFTLSALFTPILLLILAPWIWFLWRTGGTEFLQTVFWANQFGRFFTFHNQDLPKDPYFFHKEPFYYYIISLPVALLPWFLLIPPALVHWFSRKPDLSSSLHKFLCVSLVSMLIILHISSAKVTCYALPAFPILFLMTAIWLEDVTTGTTPTLARWAIGITTGLIVLLNILIPLAYIFLTIMPDSFFLRYFKGIHLVKVTGIFSSFLCLAMATFAIGLLVAFGIKLWRLNKAGRRSEAWLSLPLFASIIMIINCETVIPAYDYQRTYVPFANMVNAEKLNGRRIAMACDEELYIGAFTFYTKSNIKILKSIEEVEIYLSESVSPSGVIVMTKDLDTWLKPLVNRKLRVMRAKHGGYKCDYFRLVLNES